MSLIHRLFAGFASIALLGCGNLADEDSSPPPLATMTGTLTLADGAEIPDSQIRMALVWRTEESNRASDSFIEGCGFGEAFLTYATQDIALDSTFPNQFTLNITEPPPEEALTARVEGGEQISAEAYIIVYADGNGNAALDMWPRGGTSPDRMLGASFGSRDPGYSVHQMQVLYFTEDYSDEYITASAGFTLQLYPLGEGTVDLVPIDTPIELALSGAGYLQDFLCEQQCHRRDDQFECPADPNDLPTIPEGAIGLPAGNAGGTAYRWQDDDGRSTIYAICGAGTYTWNRTRSSDCTRVEEGCNYEQATVATELWPCDE